MAIFTTRPREELGATLPVAAPPPGGGRGGRRPSVQRAGGALRRRWGWLLLAVVLAAGSLVGTEIAGGTPTYAVRAVFAKAPGLFPGAAVEVLGVPVGTVSTVRNAGSHVVVGLAIDRGRPVPATVGASLVSPQILGEPSIELAPGYTGGPALHPGATIPLRRTAVPVSTERLLKSLEAMLRRLNPHAVGNLVTNLATDLQGQGKHLNTLIAGAAGTLELLATKADDLGQLSGSLAQLTGTLDARTSQITQLITAYDTVSRVVAQHGAQLGGAVTQLSEASTQLVQLLVPNLGPLESDVGSVTRVGRTLDRNLTSVDETLSSATALFAGAGRVYTPAHNWLTLNAQTPTGLTGALLTGLVRDRLAGVCRRILAHHAAGLTPAQRQTLATCGNPRSSFFNPIIDQIPAVLHDVSAGTLPSPTSPATIFKQGLSKIPGAPGGPSPGGPSPRRGAPPTTSPTTPSTTGPGGTSGGSSSGSGSGTPTTAKTTKQQTATCLGGLLGGVVTCTTGATGTSTSGGSGGGLLAYDVPAGRKAGLASLTAAATRDLPPLPAAAPGARHLGRHPHHGRRRRERHHGASRGTGASGRSGALEGARP